MKRDLKRASSSGVIPKARIKTIKMTFVIVLGMTSSIVNYDLINNLVDYFLILLQSTSVHTLLESIFCLGPSSSIWLHS